MRFSRLPVFRQAETPVVFNKGVLDAIWNRLYDALLSVNVSPDRAKYVVDSLESAMTEQLATKADLAKLEISAKADIARLEASTKAEIARVEAAMALLEQRLTIKLGGMLIVAVGVLAAIIKL